MINLAMFRVCFQLCIVVWSDVSKTKMLIVLKLDDYD